MKSHIKCFYILGIFASSFIFGGVRADNSVTCPAGCFCHNSLADYADVGNINNIGSLLGRNAQSGKKVARNVNSGRAADLTGLLTGLHTGGISMDDLRLSALCENHARPLTRIENSGNIKMYQDISVALSRSSGVAADYYVEDFSEFYESELGFYGFFNNKFVYGYAQSDYAMLACPETFPNSEPGSISLSQCFQYDDSGNKIYYVRNFSNGNSDVSVLLKNLQSALAQANKAAQDLQRALGTSNILNTDFADPGAIKDLINSGASGKAGNKKSNGINIRASSKKTSGVDVKAAKAAIKAGI